MKETDIQKKILSHLRKNEIGFFFKFHNGPFGHSGVSDIVGVCYGIAIFMEVKSEKGRLTKLQDKFLRDASAQGAVCGVVRSVDDAMGLIAMAKMQAHVDGSE